MSANSRRITMTLRLENGLYYQLRDRALFLDVSRNWLIEQAIAFYLDRAFTTTTSDNVSSAIIQIRPRRKK